MVASKRGRAVSTSRALYRALRIYGGVGGAHLGGGGGEVGALGGARGRGKGR